MSSPALIGTTYGQSRPFALAFNAAGGLSAKTAIAAGSYYLVATEPCLCIVQVTASATAAALPSSQSAAGGTGAGHFYVPANTQFALDVEGDSMFIAALGATASSGTLNVTGPVGRSSHG